MKRVAIYLSITAVLLLTCSKKSSGPVRIEQPDNRLPFVQILDFQNEQGQLLDSLLTELDTINAKAEVLRAVLKRRDIVKRVIPTSQGITFLYIDGSRGGIMVDPEDFANIAAKSLVQGDSSNPVPCDTCDIPKSGKTAFLCPIYSSRKDYADAILSNIESATRKTDFNDPEVFLDDSCGLGVFNDLTRYGIVHIYSHGFVWPSKDSIDNIYLMTGERATEETEQSYSQDIEVGSVIPVYVSGEGNRMFISPGFVSTRNVFTDDIPIFYLGFGYSMLGTWQKALTMVSKVGVCIGYDWRIFADRNVSWVSDFYSKMSDTTTPTHTSILDWYNYTDKFYIDNYETIPPLPHKTHIEFNGLSSISLWRGVRVLQLDYTTPAVGYPGILLKLHGSGFGATSENGTVTLGGSEVTIISWSEKIIEILIPDDAVSGDIVVHVGEDSSNPISLMILWIEGIAPQWGGIGSFVSISGRGFGSKVSQVIFEGDNALGEVTSWSDTLINVLVPENAVSGTVKVYVEGEIINSSHVFKVIRIDSLIPDRGLNGDTISVIGTNFLDYKITDSVMFGDALGTITYWSDTLVNVIVPQIESIREISLHVKGNVSNRIEFIHFGVTSLQPTWGPPGTEITISGYGFGQERGNVSIAGEYGSVDVLQWDDTLVIGKVTTNARRGKVRIATNNVSSNGITFDLFRIDSIQPNMGYVNDTISIHGTGFRDYESSDGITLGGEPVVFNDWSAEMIRFIIPAGAQTGNIVVTVNGVLSNGIECGVMRIPSVSGLVPDFGTYGSTVAIEGAYFGNKQLSRRAMFGDTEASVTLWSDTLIQCEYPFGSKSGSFRIEAYGQTSNDVSYEVFGITEIVPEFAIVGDTITIHGTNFGDQQSQSDVVSGDIVMPVDVWIDTLVRVIVTDGMVSGNVAIRKNGILSNPAYLNVLTSAKITSISPDWGPYGTEVTILGKMFGNLAGDVFFDKESNTAQILSWSDNEIRVKVPEEASSGAVWVRISGDETNGILFRVFRINEVLQTSATPGDTIDIIGENFLDFAAGNIARIDGFVSKIISWSDTIIRVEIPMNATNGTVQVSIDNFSTNEIEFDLRPLPTVTQVQPEYGAYDEEVSLIGYGFGDSPENGRILFNSMPVTASFWSDSLVVTTFPRGSTSGNVRVEVNGKSGNTAPYEVFGISNLYPAKTQIGTLVTIHGAGFGDEQGENYLTLTGGVVEPDAWQRFLITFFVPRDAISGDVVVYMNGQPSNIMKLTTGVLYELQEPDRIRIDFKAAIHTTDEIKNGVSMAIETPDAITWDFSSFTAISDTSRNGSYYYFEGAVNAAVDSIDIIYCYSYHYLSNWWDQNLDKEEVYTFVAHDIPLTEAVTGDSTYFIFGLTGTELSSHITDFKCFYRQRYGNEDWQYWWRFDSIDWNDSEHPPSLTIRFEK